MDKFIKIDHDGEFTHYNVKDNEYDNISEKMYESYLKGLTCKDCIIETNRLPDKSILLMKVNDEIKSKKKFMLEVKKLILKHVQLDEKYFDATFFNIDDESYLSFHYLLFDKIICEFVIDQVMKKLNVDVELVDYLLMYNNKYEIVYPKLDDYEFFDCLKLFSLRNKSVINYKIKSKWLKGLTYEHYVNGVLNGQDNVKKAWLWKDIPEEHLRKTCLLHKGNFQNFIKNRKISDSGVDILVLHDDGSYTFVQCKNYNSSIYVHSLAGFYRMMANYLNVKGEVYYTSKLSKNVSSELFLKHDRIQYIQKKINKNYFKSSMNENASLKLYPYQEDVVDNYLVPYYQENNVGHLVLPCGTGKTLITAYYAYNNYKTTIVISLLIQYAEQNINRFCEYFNYDESILICSKSGTRDIDEINGRLENCDKKSKILLSFTYKSVDILNEIIGDLEDFIIIIDEFHNLSWDNIFDKNNKFYDVVRNKNYKKCFVSATPVIYDLENDEGLDLKIFGKRIYEMTFQYAIDNKLICDYTVLVPTIVKENTKNMLKKFDEDYINEIDGFNELLGKVMFFVKGITNYGTKKSIVYLNTLSEVDAFMEVLLECNKKYYKLDLYVDKIIYKTSQNQRTKIFKEYEEFDGYGVLCCVNILSECFDMKCCKCIFDTTEMNNQAKIIQRMCRAIRINGNDNHAIVMLWGKNDELVHFVESLCKSDVNFVKKVMVMDDIYDEEVKTVKIVKSIENKKLEIADFLIAFKNNVLDNVNFVIDEDQLCKILSYYDRYNLRKSLRKLNEDNNLKLTENIHFLIKKTKYKNQDRTMYCFTLEGAIKFAMSSGKKITEQVLEEINNLVN